MKELNNWRIFHAQRGYLAIEPGRNPETYEFKKLDDALVFAADRLKEAG